MFTRAMRQWNLNGFLLIGIIHGMVFPQSLWAQDELQRTQGVSAIADSVKAQEWRLKGEAAKIAGNNREAIHAFREAVCLAPDEAAYRISLGQSLAQNKELEAAIKELEEASRLNPGDGESRALLGAILYMKRDFNGAISEYQKALTLNLAGSRRLWVKRALSEALKSRMALETEIEPDYSDPVYWLEKIEEWRRAAEAHRPGGADMAAVTIGTWDHTELKAVFYLTRRFFKTSYKLQKTLPAIRDRKLPEYLGIKKEEDKNSALKKGALLHTDIALLELETAPEERADSRKARILESLRNLRNLKMKDFNFEVSWEMKVPETVLRDLGNIPSSEMTLINDGRSVPIDEGRHMGYARLLMDSVKPDPSQDELVRQWYAATSAYGFSRGRATYIEKHLRHALDIFPSDPEILFLAGLLHEEYASSRYQNGLRPLDPNCRPLSRQKELELARELFQRSAVADPHFAEARLRLGRVTGLLGDHRRAIVELEQAARALADPQMQYYAALFIGREQAVLGRKVEALAQFRRAATMYPMAQSPLLAESQLAQSMGDIENASLAMERAYAAAVHGSRQDDPRLAYMLVSQTKAEGLMAEMRRIFGELSQ